MESLFPILDTEALRTLPWRAIGGISWRDWHEDEVAVYSDADGNTYLLSAASWQALSQLIEAGAPLTAAEIATRLLPLCDPSTTHDDVMALLDEALSEFYRIGLANPVVPSN